MFTNLPFAGKIETLAKPQYNGSPCLAVKASTASTALFLAFRNISAGSIPSALNLSRSLFSSIVFICSTPYLVIIQYNMASYTVNLILALYLVSFLFSGTILCGFLRLHIIIYVEFTKFHPNLLWWPAILVYPLSQYLKSLVIIRRPVHLGTLRSQWHG